MADCRLYIHSLCGLLVLGSLWGNVVDLKFREEVGRWVVFRLVEVKLAGFAYFGDNVYWEPFGMTFSCGGVFRNGASNVVVQSRRWKPCKPQGSLVRDEPWNVHQLAELFLKASRIFLIELVV
ncbi:hypothetical protein J6590_056351 [Homalodisca vitripennis]|nr:hypothetical protein J6590_056351 [Homalodisca vitripennis]